MSQKINGLAGAIILALGLQPVGNAFADAGADNRLLDILLNKGTITKQEYDELKESSKYDVDASTKGGHLKFKSANGDFTMQVGGRLMVDTGTLEVDDTTTWGLDAATVLGPFSLQGEYVGVSVNNKHESDADFNGWYAFASWFITGESRKYKNGAFSRVTPNSIVGKGGHGAWEVAARVSKIDLNDADIDGGEESNFTLGVNWYATPSIRFMANYVNVYDHDKGDVSDEPAVLQFRGQIDF